MKSTKLWLLAAFAVGCATSAVVTIPRATATSFQKWEHWCMDTEGVPNPDDLRRAGDQGWELVSTTFRPPVVLGGSSFGGGATYLCFKRPH